MAPCDEGLSCARPSKTLLPVTIPSADVRRAPQALSTRLGRSCLSVEAHSCRVRTVLCVVSRGLSPVRQMLILQDSDARLHSTGCQWAWSGAHADSVGEEGASIAGSRAAIC